MKFLLAIALVLCASIADARPFSRRGQSFESTPAVQVVEQKVAPPQDAAKWYCSVFADEQAAAVYTGWFTSNPTLNKVQKQTHFAVYTPSSVMFKQRFAANTKAPCIRLQDSKGVVVGEWQGSAIPKTADALASQVSAAIKSYSGPVSGPFRRGCPCGPDCDCNSCPWRKDKPQPTPQPSPQPSPEPQPEPEPGPPVIDDEPAHEDIPVGAAIVSALVGAGLGGRRKWIEAYRKH